MIDLDRVRYETTQTERKLHGIYMEQHQRICAACGGYSFFWLMRHVRLVSAMIWSREQAKGSGVLPPMPGEYQRTAEELSGEITGILSDYGNLTLKGLRLSFLLMALWLLVQIVATVDLNLVQILLLLIACMFLYPIGVYRFWNRGRNHAFKDVKLLFGIIGAFVLGGAIIMLSRLNGLNTILQGSIRPNFNTTEFLILLNTAILLSFIIHYRATNLFEEIISDYKQSIVSLSDLNPSTKERIHGLLNDLNTIPLKAVTKRNLKRQLIQRYSDCQEVPETWVQDFVRANCIDMNWLYWTGTALQWTLAILMVSKLVWTLDTGFMVSADFYRQELTTGMVLGALAISAAVICPLNRGFRELLYHGATFSLKHVWLLMGAAVLSVSIVLVTGLIPSRFIWGLPTNPAPHAWALVLIVVLVAALQFIKNDTRSNMLEKCEK